jgi:hypothetical protein
MNAELPPQLEPTRQVLEASLRLRPEEKTPVVPDGLLDELNDRFASRRIVIEPKRHSVWVEGLKRLLASPGFGLSAAAVLLLGIVTPILQHQSVPPATERFRGHQLPGQASSPAMIVLVGEPPEMANNLALSGQFVKDRVMSVKDLAATESVANPKIILDFDSASIRAIDEEGETVHRGTLPESIADLSSAVAEALTHL